MIKAIAAIVLYLAMGAGIVMCWYVFKDLPRDIKEILNGSDEDAGDLNEHTTEMV